MRNETKSNQRKMLKIVFFTLAFFAISWLAKRDSVWVLLIVYIPHKTTAGTEEQIHCAGIIHSLLEAGMDMEKIKAFMKLFYENERDKSGQIQILRKQWFLLLDEIHKKQQSLDELDI